MLDLGSVLGVVLVIALKLSALAPQIRWDSVILLPLIVSGFGRVLIVVVSSQNRQQRGNRFHSERTIAEAWADEYTGINDSGD